MASDNYLNDSKEKKQISTELRDSISIKHTIGASKQ